MCRPTDSPLASTHANMLRPALIPLFSSHTLRIYLQDAPTHALVASTSHRPAARTAMPMPCANVCSHMTVKRGGKILAGDDSSAGGLCYDAISSTFFFCLSATNLTSSTIQRVTKSICQPNVTHHAALILRHAFLQNARRLAPRDSSSPLAAPARPISSARVCHPIPLALCLVSV